MSGYPGLIEADCMACASAKLAQHGDFFEATRKGYFIGHPSIYSKCGNKRCPCAAHHDNECTGSNEPGQPGSLYPAIDYAQVARDLGHLSASSDPKPDDR